MSRLRIQSINRKKQAQAWPQLLSAYVSQTHMLFWTQVGFIFTLWRQEIDDYPANVERRNVDGLFSPRNRIDFLRFTRAKRGLSNKQQLLALSEKYVRDRRFVWTLDYV